MRGEDGFDGTSGPVHTGDGSDSEDDDDDDDDDEYETDPIKADVGQRRMDALSSSGALFVGGSSKGADSDDDEAMPKATEGQANRWFASRPLLASVSAGAMIEDDDDEDSQAPERTSRAGRKRTRESQAELPAALDGSVVDFEASSSKKKRRTEARRSDSDSDDEVVDPLANLPLSDRDKRKQKLKRNRERAERKAERLKKKLDREIEVAAASMKNGRPQEKSGPVPVAED